MKCLEAQRLIQPYLEHKLSDREMRQFLDHVEHCPDCYEELELTLAVTRAVDPDQEQDRRYAGEYDFEKQLKNEIARSRRYLRIERTNLMVRHILIGIAELILVLTMITGVELQRPAGRYGTTLYRIIHRGETEKPMDTGFEQVTEDLTEIPAVIELPTETLAESVHESSTESSTEKMQEKTQKKTQAKTQKKTKEKHN